MKRYGILLILVIALSATGCSGIARGQDGDILDPDGNVVLYVSNQSRAAGSIGIDIAVDGHSVANEVYEHGDGHNWSEYRLKLSPGKHVLTARTASGGTEIKKSFMVFGKRWIAVDYWYSPGGEYGSVVPSRFSWLIRNSPIMFM